VIRLAVSCQTWRCH